MWNFTHLKHRPLSPYSQQRCAQDTGFETWEPLPPGSVNGISHSVSTVDSSDKGSRAAAEGCSPRGPTTQRFSCSHGGVSNHRSQPSTSIFSRLFSQFPQEGISTTLTRRSYVSAPLTPAPSGAARSDPRGSGSRGRGLAQGFVCRRKAAGTHLPGDLDFGAVTHHDVCYCRNKLLLFKKACFLNSSANTKGLQGREQAFLGGCGGATTGSSFLQSLHPRAQTRQGARTLGSCLSERCAGLLANPDAWKNFSGKR